MKNLFFILSIVCSMKLFADTTRIIEADIITNTGGTVAISPSSILKTDASIPQKGEIYVGRPSVGYSSPLQYPNASGYKLVTDTSEILGVKWVPDIPQPVQLFETKEISCNSLSPVILDSPIYTTTLYKITVPYTSVACNFSLPTNTSSFSGKEFIINLRNNSTSVIANFLNAPYEQNINGNFFVNPGEWNTIRILSDGTYYYETSRAR